MSRGNLHVYRRPWDYIDRSRRRRTPSSTPSGVIARSFDGVDDQLSAGDPGLTGAFTWAALMRQQEGMGGQPSVFLTPEGGFASWRTFFVGTGSFILRQAPGGTWGGDSSTTSCSLKAQDGWGIVAVTKASGSALPRFHVYKNGGWTHADGGAALPDYTPTTTGTIFANNILGLAEMDYAVAAAWQSALSDGSIEGLSTNWKTQDWYDASPTVLWDFNQASVATPVEDLVGALDETAITGTDVILDGPEGWIYGVGVDVPIGVAIEDNVANAVTAPETVHLGVATETDVANALTVTEAVHLGVAIEDDVANPLTAPETVHLGLATETDVANPVTLSETVHLGVATETDVANPLTFTETVHLGVATETDVALPVTVIEGGAPPDELRERTRVGVGL